MNDGLKRAREVALARKEAGIPTERMDPEQKAHANPSSRALAVAGKCWQCICGDADPDPRGRIRDCNIPKCCLYPHRPYQ